MAPTTLARRYADCFITLLEKSLVCSGYMRKKVSKSNSKRLLFVITVSAHSYDHHCDVIRDEVVQWAERICDQLHWRSNSQYRWVSGTCSLQSFRKLLKKSSVGSSLKNNLCRASTMRYQRVNWGQKTGTGIRSLMQKKVQLQVHRNDAFADTSHVDDPFLTTNYLGMYECRLCGTRHRDMESYRNHITGKRHATFLARASSVPESQKPEPPAPQRPMKTIGVPRFKISSVQHPATKALGFLLVVEVPKIEAPHPAYRFVSTYEQATDPIDPRYQYLIIAARPYTAIGFRIPNTRINITRDFSEYFDQKRFIYQLQFFYTSE